MRTSRRSFLATSAATAALLSVGQRRVVAQEPPIRIGVIYDHSGPFAAGGSVACSVGTQIAIDLVNEKGGVAGKYKVEPVNADSQSKAEVAINEVERLINQEKVDIVNGVYASAHAVPLAAKIDAQKKILWITTAVSTAVFNTARHLRDSWRTMRRPSSAPRQKASRLPSFTRMGPMGSALPTRASGSPRTRACNSS
jgi:branched-chain amino acid transport system substrate-binding protein